MFGKNQIIGKKYFKDAPDNQLLVTSIFYTLQGEGPFRGRPAVFVRLSKCNLACSFCDTYFDNGDWLTFDEIIDRINQVVDDFNDRNQTTIYGTKDLVLVITGGEPSLQDNLLQFIELVNEHDLFAYVQIESNGILNPPVPRDTIVVVSPKCVEDKDGNPLKYIRPNDLVIQRADCLKFVVSADPNSVYHTIPDWAFDFEGEVFVSPMNVYAREPQKAKQLRSEKNDISLEERSTVDETIDFWEEGLLDRTKNEANHKYAALLCMQHGFTLNLQLHLYAGLA